VTFTLSPPIRYAALAALLLAVLVGGGMMMLGHGGDSSSSVATPQVIKHHPFGSAVKKPTTATPAPKKQSIPRAKAKATPPPAAARKAREQASIVLAALAAGLPSPIARALGQHRTVVVSLYNPYSEVDGISFAEARAGAKISGAAFVPLNVLSAAQVGKLTETLGLLPDPGLLIYIRPGTLVARISGFADKETVAQAAQNAAHGT
jgi:hypothetical protein